MPMVVVPPAELVDLQARGVVVQCSQCQRAIDRKPEKGVAFCQVLRVQCGTTVLRVCSSFEERH